MAAFTTQQDLARFCEDVTAKPVLQARLRQSPNADAFPWQVVELGRELGYAFTVDDVDAALRAARRVWLERWM